jgi:hypothetical protein
VTEDIESLFIQHRHFANDGFCQRLHQRTVRSGFCNTNIPDFAQPIRAAHRIRAVGKNAREIRRYALLT